MDHHGAEVSALVAVVRAVVADLAQHGRPLRAIGRDALALLERWVAHEVIADDVLANAQSRVHEDGVPRAEREPDRAIHWANTALGNTLWMARKGRGWKGVPPSIMDAATYALSSLAVAGVRDHIALEALRTAALAGLVRAAQGDTSRPKSAPRAPKIARKARKKRLGQALVPFIGATANARLAALDAVFDPTLRGVEADLRILLARHGYPVHAAVLAFEERYGGLVFADAPDESGHDWCFGAFACLSGDAHVSPRGGTFEALVPVAYSPNDAIYFLDAEGAAWAQDTIEDARAAPFAKDGDELVARIAESLLPGR